jgi:GAF domain-containing protein
MLAPSPDANIQTTLASQLATALKNSQSFTESKARADLESLVNTIGQKIQRSATVEDTLQIAIRELGLALGASRVSANIQTNRENINAGSN